jgi:hypothetical protein
MLHLFLNLAFTGIESLVAKSITNPNTAAVLTTNLLPIIKQVVEAMTDDDKDNTKQVNAILVANEQKLFTAIKLLTK